MKKVRKIRNVRIDQLVKKVLKVWHFRMNMKKFEKFLIIKIGKNDRMVEMVKSPKI